MGATERWTSVLRQARGKKSAILEISIPPQAGPPAEPGVYLKKIMRKFQKTAVGAVSQGRD